MNALAWVLIYLTSLLGGLTVWSINGRVASHSPHNEQIVIYSAVDPVVQVALAFFTILSLIISTIPLMSRGRTGSWPACSGM